MPKTAFFWYWPDSLNLMSNFHMDGKEVHGFSAFESDSYIGMVHDNGCS